jgi:hypothetical protein
MSTIKHMSVLLSECHSMMVCCTTCQCMLSIPPRTPPALPPLGPAWYTSCLLLSGHTQRWWSCSRPCSCPQWAFPHLQRYASHSVWLMNTQISASCVWQHACGLFAKLSSRSFAQTHQAMQQVCTIALCMKEACQACSMPMPLLQPLLHISCIQFNACLLTHAQRSPTEKCSLAARSQT